MMNVRTPAFLAGFPMTAGQVYHAAPNGLQVARTPIGTTTGSEPGNPAPGLNIYGWDPNTGAPLDANGNALPSSGMLPQAIPSPSGGNDILGGFGFSGMGMAVLGTLYLTAIVGVGALAYFTIRALYIVNTKKNPTRRASVGRRNRNRLLGSRSYR